MAQRYGNPPNSKIDLGDFLKKDGAIGIAKKVLPYADTALDIAGLVAGGFGEVGMSEEEQRRWEAEYGLKRGAQDFDIERKRQAERRRARLEQSLSDYLSMGGK
jgi:hypothetical protein